MTWTANFWQFAIETTFRSTVVMLAGVAVAYCLRARSAAARDLVWTSVLAALLLLPIAQLLPSRLSVSPLEAAAYISAGIGTIAGMKWHWTSYIFYVWATVTLLLLLRLMAGVLGSLWIVSRATPMPIPADGSGWRGPEALLSSAVRVPITTGILLNRVVLPEEARGWPVMRIRLTLMHEMAHVHRRDCLFNLLSEIVCALYWFHPLAWITARRRRLDAEKACDDQVLAAGSNAGAYADHLLSVARSAKLRWLSGAMSAAITGDSGLEKRLVAILDEKLDRRGVRRAGVLAALAVGFTAVLTCLTPAIAQNSGSDRAYHIGEDGVTSPKVLYKVEPPYTQEARDAHIEGTVSIGLEIDTAGLPQNVHVTENLDSGLDQQAVEAVRQWKFDPGRKDGKPIRVAATIEVNFRLE